VTYLLGFSLNSMQRRALLWMQACSLLRLQSRTVRHLEIAPHRKHRGTFAITEH
jgi:hypothetical protein